MNNELKISNFLVIKLPGFFAKIGYAIVIS